VIHKQLEDLRNLQALKEDLFSLIVHDLRNPLAGIAGFLELLQLQLAPGLANERRSVDLALDSAKKLRRLLDEILEVKSLEGRAFPLKKEPAQLAVLALDAAATVQGAASAKGVKIEELAGEELPPLSVDPSLVRRAFENLIMNAVKFSPQKERVA